MIEQCQKWWCRHFHNELLRPVRGEYRCAVCLRTWPVPWETRNLDRVATIPRRENAVKSVLEEQSRGAAAGYR